VALLQIQGLYGGMVGNIDIHDDWKNSVVICG
jgi:hypothetical protein